MHMMWGANVNLHVYNPVHCALLYDCYIQEHQPWKNLLLKLLRYDDKYNVHCVYIQYMYIHRVK